MAFVWTVEKRIKLAKYICGLETFDIEKWKKLDSLEREPIRKALHELSSEIFPYYSLHDKGLSINWDAQLQTDVRCVYNCITQNIEPTVSDIEFVNAEQNGRMETVSKYISEYRKEFAMIMYIFFRTYVEFKVDYAELYSYICRLLDIKSNESFYADFPAIIFRVVLKHGYDLSEWKSLLLEYENYRDKLAQKLNALENSVFSGKEVVVSIPENDNFSEGIPDFSNKVVYEKYLDYQQIKAFVHKDAESIDRKSLQSITLLAEEVRDILPCQGAQLREKLFAEKVFLYANGSQYRRIWYLYKIILDIIEFQRDEIRKKILAGDSKAFKTFYDNSLFKNCRIKEVVPKVQCLNNVMEYDNWNKELVEEMLDSCQLLVGKIFNSFFDYYNYLSDQSTGVDIYSKFNDRIAANVNKVKDGRYGCGAFGRRVSRIFKIASEEELNIRTAGEQGYDKICKQFLLLWILYAKAQGVDFEIREGHEKGKKQLYGDYVVNSLMACRFDKLDYSERFDQFFIDTILELDKAKLDDRKTLLRERFAEFEKQYFELENDMEVMGVSPFRFIVEGGEL